MKVFLVVAGLLFHSILISADWGPTGHRTIGQIAEEHLSPEAKIAIDFLLNGQSLAWVSTYADEIKSDTGYRRFYSWHFANFDLEESYEESEKNKYGDVIRAIDSCVAILKDTSASEGKKSFYLKLLVHFMGDVHQPMHLAQYADRGGNKIQVRWFDEGSNLHKVWDENMIEYYRMSFTELANNRKELSDTEVEHIQSGQLIDWVRETRLLTPKVYQSVEVGEKLGYKYHYDYFPILLDQLHKAGLRLAKVLNDIYG